jgi:hypothetical protein
MIASEDSYMGGVTTLLYFTIQSNMWIGLTCLLFVVFKLINKDLFKRWMYIMKFVFTVSITLTGIVFCFVLAPTMSVGAWTTSNILTHVIVPVCSIADLFVDRGDFKYKHSHCMLSLLPPVYYLIFAIVCYVSNVKFAYGVNYPYFFLNFGSPAGIFGFSNEMPYFMGTFYWIVVMLLLVLSFAYTYLLIHNKTCKQK